MTRVVLAGIGIGAAVCAAGIAYGPTIGPEAAAVFAPGLGGIALLTAAWRHHPASVGLGATALLLIGGYALATGTLTGAAGILAAVLTVGAALLLGRTLLRGWPSGWGLPG